VKQECLEDIRDVEEELNLMNDEDSDPREHDLGGSSIVEHQSLMKKVD